MGKMLRIGIIGGSGWLGGAIAQALLDTNLATPDRLTLSYRSKRPSLLDGAYWTTDNQELADRSDVIIVSVRPVDWPSLAVAAPGKLAISVMAGIRLAELAGHLKTDRVVRALPNAAAEVRRSYTPWVASPAVTDADRSTVRGIFNACGVTDEVGSEADIDYLTGLSGSGPAFPALLAQAMMRDAVTSGIDPGIARRAVTSVLIGTGLLFDKNPEDPADTVETFLSYRGTTAAAIEAMLAGGFEAAVAQGLSAAREKSLSMGQGF